MYICCRNSSVHYQILDIYTCMYNSNCLYNSCTHVTLDNGLKVYPQRYMYDICFSISNNQYGINPIYVQYIMLLH